MHTYMYGHMHSYAYTHKHNYTQTQSHKDHQENLTIIKNNTKNKVDGLKLHQMSEEALEKEVGMSDAAERANLIAKIQSFFKFEHAFKRCV